MTLLQQQVVAVRADIGPVAGLEHHCLPLHSARIARQSDARPTTALTLDAWGPAAIAYTSGTTGTDIRTSSRAPTSTSTRG